MDALLSPAGTTYKSAAKEEPFLQEVKKSTTTTTSSSELLSSAAPARQAFTASSVDEALSILKNEPDYDTLVAVLRFLLSAKASVDIRTPTPLSAQLVQVLVTAIVPNYWTVLNDESKSSRAEAAPKKGSTGLELLLGCLQSITGLSALSVRLRALLAETRTPRKDDTADKDTPGNLAWQLRVLLEVLSELLAGDETVAHIWSASLSGANDEAKKRPLQHEFLSIIGSGKIVSLAAEAETVVQDECAAEKPPPFWIASGREFSAWITRNILHWTRKNRKPNVQKVQGALLGKALRLGYLDAVISILAADLIHGDSLAAGDVLEGLLEQLPAYEQKKMLNSMLKYAADTYLSSSSLSAGPASVDAGLVSAVAGLIQKVIGTNSSLRDQLVSWLLTSPGVGLLNGIGIRRAATAVVAKDQSTLADIFEKSMAEFGDQLFIKHAPMLQQEAKAQIILLSAAYVRRHSQRSLTSLLRSRTYLSLVTNRLGASHTRAKFLGMVVGEALSGLVDDGKAKLDFHMDEMNTDEAAWYKSLAQVNDSVGEPGTLGTHTPNTAQAATSTKPKLPKPAPKAAPKAAPKPQQPKTSGFIIEELDDDDDDDDDDLKTYAKPDSDSDDSDDDPTLVSRDKPKAPVYIRDLISYFRDTDNYDKQKLALTTAPLLIRRKATFGTEVQQHAQELAAILVGLQDAFDIEDFSSLRLQGMVALAVAQPRLIGPYYALAFFEGDYSLSQRASVLSALGLGARELAGFDVSEYAAESAFPTKQLPGRVEHLYVPSQGTRPGAQPGGPSSLKAIQRGALDSIADSLTASFLRPIAAKAADDATGPDVLKLASFTSRYKDSKDVGAAAAARRKKPVQGAVNTSGQLLASAVFFPLISRFQLALQASSPARLRNVLFEPSLLSLYLKTLAVVLHATGPTALALPDMTAELWTLVLSSSVQKLCVGDLLVTQAVLFALMAILDVNESRVRELCRDLPREVVQTRDWALQVVEAMRMAGADVADQRSQESEVQMLAAGTYIRLSEGMESYRSLLMGEMIG